MNMQNGHEGMLKKCFLGILKTNSRLKTKTKVETSILEKKVRFGILSFFSKCSKKFQICFSISSRFSDFFSKMSRFCQQIWRFSDFRFCFFKSSRFFIFFKFSEISDFSAKTKKRKCLKCVVCAYLECHMINI